MNRKAQRIIDLNKIIKITSFVRQIKMILRQCAMQDGMIGFAVKVV